MGLIHRVDICLRVWCPTSWKIFEIYRSFLILFIPFIIMLVTYTKICIELWKMPNSRKKLTETPHENIKYVVMNILIILNKCSFFFL
jgi:hypothetical protein